MSLKQLEYEIAADSFKYADNVSLEDSEKDYSVEEVNFDSQDVENKEDKPEPEKKEVQTESVNKNSSTYRDQKRIVRSTINKYPSNDETCLN